MNKWAVFLNFNTNPEMFHHIVEIDKIQNKDVIFKYKNNLFKASVNDIRYVETPKYKIGDIVLYYDKQDKYGEIIDIMFHFNKCEPLYFIKKCNKKDSIFRITEKELLNINKMII